MISRETKKKLKQIKKDMKKLKKEFRKIEFRPCQNDTDLIQKDKELASVKEKIYELEKEMDRCMLNTGHVKHGI